MATYGGEACLGFAVHVQADKVPLCVDRAAFFGVDGTFSIYGGSRGFVYHIDGVLFGNSVEGLLVNEALLYSFADAYPRTLIDDVGRTWLNVIFLGEYVPSREGPKFTSSGVILPYTATFYGLV